MIRFSEGITPQDLGRPGYRSLGIPVSGALDPDALRVANLLVGNPLSSTALEIAFPAIVECPEHTLLALAGGGFEASYEGQTLPFTRSILVAKGGKIGLRATTTGAVCYLAVGGGMVAEPILGSRSTYLSSGFALRAAEDTVQEGPLSPVSKKIADSLHSSEDWSYARWRPSLPRTTDEAIRILPGPEFPALSLALAAGWRVQTSYLRAGLRLISSTISTPQPLPSFPSAATAPGLLQATPDGGLYLFQVDSPTVGGYPRVGVVCTADLPRAAQLRTGDELRFLAIDQAEALALLRTRTEAFEQAEQAIRLRLG